MIEDVEILYTSLEASGTPERYTHRVTNIQVFLVKSKAYNVADFHFSLFNFFHARNKYGGV